MDNAATTALNKEVLDAMMPYLTDIYGNPSSLHTFGQEAHKAVADAREKVARALNAADAEKEIIFTGCGTESDNMVLRGIAERLSKKGKHIITTAVEHHAVLYTCRYLEKQGFEVTYLPVDEFGRVTAEQVREAIRPDTILVRQQRNRHADAHCRNRRNLPRARRSVPYGRSPGSRTCSHRCSGNEH